MVPVLPPRQRMSAALAEPLAVERCFSVSLPPKTEQKHKENKNCLMEKKWPQVLTPHAVTTVSFSPARSLALTFRSFPN